jgi:hypothetical protein
MGAQETAQAQVDLKYGAQQDAINRQIQAIKDQTASNEVGLNQYGTQGRAAIGDVYNILGGLLTTNRAQSAQDIGQAANLVGSGYDAANAYQNAVANAGRSRLSTLAGQMGAGAAGNLQVQTPLEGDLANILGQNAQAQAAATGNLRTWGTQWDQILGQGQNIGEQTRAKGLSDFETELLKLVGENKTTGLQGENEQYGKLSDILSAKQNDLISTFNQLAQQEWENAFRQAQLDQEAQKANASLAMQAAQMQAEDARASRASSQAGQLTQKDLIMMALQQQENEASGKQQQFENNRAISGDQFDRMKFNAQMMGGDPNEQGNSALLSYLMGDSYSGDPQDLATKASQLHDLGFGTNFWDSTMAQQQSQPAYQQSSPGLSSVGSIFQKGGVDYGNNSIDNAWWNPVRMGGLVHGLSSMFRAGG